MKPGDKAVCIDDSPCRNCGEIVPLIKNQVYVIEKLHTDSSGNRGPILIGVAGCSGCIDWNLAAKVGAWYSERFRLLDELKQQTRERQQKEQRV